MADKKISQLVDGGAPQATDEFVVDRAGADNFKLDWASLKTAAETDAVLDGDPAGGVLSGTYPDPGFAVDMATQAELDSESTTRAADDTTIAGGLAAHIADPTDAHAGTAVGNTPAGGIAATTVQGAINELDSEKANAANAVMDGDAAGGVLSGTYPSPGFAVDMATQAELDAVSTVASAAVPKSLYDANTVLAATADDTPSALTVGASTFVGRKAAGNISAMTATEAKAVLAIAEADVTNLTSDLAAKAPLASPTFTGTVTVPAPSNATDAATKAYVDSVAQGLSIKASCRLATAAALPAVTLVGSTLVAVGVGVLTVDGQAVALGDRILVKDQVAGAQNGIYTCTTAGTGLVAFVLTRAADSDTSAEIVGSFTFIEEGTVNAASGFVNTNSGTITVGTTAITYTQFSGAGEITAGAGLTKSGNTIDVNVDGATLEISADTLRVKDGGITQAKLASGVGGQSIARSARSSNTILAAADKGQVIAATAAYTQTFTAAATLGAGWWCIIKNDTQDGTTVLTLDPNSAETIDALATKTMYSGDCRLVECDGSNFFSQLLEGGFAKFTPGSSSFIVPTGLTSLDVVCVGSGGGGGGGASGAGSGTQNGGGSGGGGAATFSKIRGSDVTAGATITVTVNGGGSSGAAAGNGGNGANTTFGSLLKAGGGGGGTASGGVGGAGGSPVSTSNLGTGAAPTTATNNLNGTGGMGAQSAANAVGRASEYGGASGASRQTAGAGFGGGDSIYGGPGGGAGGTTAGSSATGGAGGGTQAYSSGGAANGGAGVGAAGTFTGPYCGTGGAGGAAAVSGTASVGGKGGVGGGGGGGGGAFNGTGGAGGIGGDGECRVWYS